MIAARDAFGDEIVEVGKENKNIYVVDVDISKIITVEDHNIINGLGSAVCERVAEAGKGKVVRIGIQDCFGQSAPYERLLAVNGITVENIVEKAMKGI